MNISWKLLTTSILALVLILVTNQAFSHAEKDKARYVASSGVDIDLCDNPLRPCKTIAFAVSRAAKGDRVLVASGSYQLETVDDFLALKSQMVPILGGYNRFDHYSNQSPSTNVTRLLGVPDNLIEHARKQGFKVIADGKSKFSQQKTAKLNRQYTAALKSHGSSECINGKSADFTCKNIELLAHVALDDFPTRPPNISDIWGHVDLNNNKEYALIGDAVGVTVFDVSTPQTPKLVGIVYGPISAYRDVKVYQYFDTTLNIWQAYAYSTVDSEADNVMIIDLNQLPFSVSIVNKDPAAAQAHNVYISNLDYTLNTALNNNTPTLQLFGAIGGKARTHSFISHSLINPKSLTAFPLGGNVANGYTHDGTSMLIDDERKDTDCNNDGKACEVFIDFNEQEINIWNATEPGKEKLLSEITYNDVGDRYQYVHSGWWSEDKRYIFAHDEFDEYRGGLNTTVRIFDLQSLTNPTLAGVWTGPTQAVDHNGYVRGNRYYMSNYKRGLTVLDITDATKPTEIGHFDTFNSSDSGGFDGAWGVYPFLPSGILLVSDITGGLFILKDNTLTSNHGTLMFNEKSITVQPNDKAIISVSRNNGSQGKTSVRWEILPGSAKPGDDYVLESGVLMWEDNESGTKEFSIDVLENLNIDEPKEKFFVRLFDPKSGATISSPSYITVNVNGKNVPGVIGFEASSIDISEHIVSHVVEVFRSGGLDSAVSVNYSILPGSASLNEDFENITGTLKWADGDLNSKTIIIDVNNDELYEEDESFDLVLEPNEGVALNSNPTLTVTIKDDENNSAPILAEIEDFEANTNQTIKLTSTATDPENDPITYHWSQVSGSFFWIKKPNDKSVNFISPRDVGDVVVKVVATDSRNASSEQTFTITVKLPKVQESVPVTVSGNWPMNLSLLLLGVAGWRFKYRTFKK